MKQDVLFDPIKIRFLSPVGVILQPQPVANLVEMLFWFLCHKSTPDAFYATLLSVILPVINLRQPKKTRPLVTHKF